MPNHVKVPVDTESPAAAASVTTWKSMPHPVPGAIVFSGSGLTWLVRIISTVRGASRRTPFSCPPCSSISQKRA